jgi:putative CocE/NonD family hydrolase
VTAALLLVTGCTPTVESQYVPMADGTKLAVDVWKPRGLRDPGPAIVRFGRYWRGYELKGWLSQLLGSLPSGVSWLNDAGYTVVEVDVRGTGASFGSSAAPWSPAEVADFPVLVDWIITQSWSNGIVGGTGISYEGVTADWLAASNHPAVRAILPTYSYSDVYLDVSHPGGIFNQRFVKAWGDVTAAMDRNDTSFIAILAASNPSSLYALFADVAASLLLGVEPISGAADALADAIRQHQDNPNVFDATSRIEYRDDPFGDLQIDIVSPLLGPPSRTRSVAMQRVVGWQDAGCARGALSAWLTLDTDYHVLVLAPHTHTGNWWCDPYYFGDPLPLVSNQVIRDVWEAVPFLDQHLRHGGVANPRRAIVYYTYVENTWHATEAWPPAGFAAQRWFFGPKHTLTRTEPTSATGADEYTVDFAATTGLENRWFSGMSGVPIRYPDRAVQDARLLTYESPPLEHAAELTGHPLVSLQLSSTHADGSFYVYLEDVAPNGKVVYLTEGALRAVHRAVSDEAPPAATFGPYHTFRRADALPLAPGEVAELTFDLLPISTVLRAGHRLRVALAGHDADTFIRYPAEAEGAPTWRVQRNIAAASWIDVPLRERPELDELPEGDQAGAPPLASSLCALAAPTLLVVGALVTLPRRRIQHPARPASRSSGHASD